MQLMACWHATIQPLRDPEFESSCPSRGNADMNREVPECAATCASYTEWHCLILALLRFHRGFVLEMALEYPSSGLS